MKIINLYFPYSLVKTKFGYLSGICIKEECANQRSVPMLIVDDQIVDSSNPNLVGKICLGKERKGMKSTWLTIQTEPNFSIQSLIIDSENFSSYYFNVIFYNPEEITKSYLFSSESKLRKKDTGNSSQSVDVFIDRVLQSSSSSPKTDIKITSKENLSSKLHNKSLSILLHIITLCRTVFFRVLNNINQFLRRKLDSQSYLISHFCCKLKQIDECYNLYLSGDELRHKALIGLFICDILFGFVSTFFMINYSSAYELHHWFNYLASEVAENVQQLLHWLSGVPAGLKLNQPLAEFLSSFFSYHVYLWVLYLEVANPLLRFFVQFFIISGILGISSQVALLVDLLNLTVLHIHCFYIYAARLHMIQMSLLGSQWRAFRGRKWNPLKARVDTRLEHSQSHLIRVMSAVNFTLAVFLLPTTVLYYSVFATFRLLLALFQSVVSLLLWALNSNPVYVVILHFSGSPLLKGDLKFDIISDELTSIHLRLSVVPSNLSNCLDAVMSPEPTKPKVHLREMWNSLIYAEKLL